MPRIRTTIALLVACLACGMLLWVLNRSSVSRAGWAGGGPAGGLFTATLRDLDYLMIERNNARAELRREADGWMLVHPVSALANQAAVRRLLDACERAPVRGRLEPHELSLRELTFADFGLQTPRARLVLSGPRARAELLLGHHTSASNELFASFLGSETVLLTDPALLDAVPESAYALSDRRFFRTDPRRVVAVGLGRPGKPFLKLARQAGVWRLTQPVAARADETAVAAMLGALAGARIAGFVWPAEGRLPDTGASLRSRLLGFGLDDDDGTGAQIQLWLAGDPVARRIKLGKAIPDRPGQIYALSADGLPVVAVTNALLDLALQPLKDLRDKRLFPAAEDDVLALSASGFGPPLALRRGVSGDWNLLSPVAERAEPEAVSRLLDGLLRLRAGDLVTAEPESDVSAGERTPRVDVAFRQTACRLLVLAGQAGEDSAVRLAFTNDATVYLVPTGLWHGVAGLLRQPVALRSRTLFALAPDEIRRITVRRPDGAQEAVERDRNGDGWRPAAPDRSLNRVALDAWLGALARMRAERIEALGMIADPARYGLDAPHLEVWIDLTAEDAIRRVLTLGSPTPDGGRYAVVKGHDTVFVLGPETWRQLDLPFLQPVAQPVPAVDTTPPPALETL